jgi:hypothetical protein
LNVKCVDDDDDDDGGGEEEEEKDGEGEGGQSL